MHERILATPRYDLISLLSVHEDEEGHQSNLDTVYIGDQAITRHSREFLEA